ncbi:hypothetical protein L1276_000241 [Flavobacterium sp. HSC-32F16]|uniref:hypothetical protein n=1 Tax=Flavobacterium sp. HSC-32F16 TaxID=2910964 RepID=UPI0020A3F3C5|nr:hypothetical protein [Flavobacterium sp. HSC-32F16]MCP2025101.1 hypothetical protein [Flavobacterium sp. HSC-32F16]
MLLNKKIIVFISLCFCFQSIYAQTDKTKKESSPKKDSTEIYTKIKNYSKKNKFTQTLHKLLFRTKRAKKKEIIIPTDSQNYEGKIIRNINVITLDPFGYSITDTTVQPKNWGERTGNRLHLKTKKIAIYNLLLFKRNVPYDTYKVQESERLIRAQRYVTAVRITHELAGAASDSVDVTIRVLDSWSTIPKFSISSNRVSVGFKEKDFFGSGQQLEYSFTNRFDDGANGNDITYTVPNIKNTYISTVLHYNMDLDNNYTKSIDIERDFYSPLTKWAGGVFVGQNFRKDTLQAPDQSFAFQTFKNNFQDLWVGKATKVYEDDNEAITNLITSARFLNVNYTESPDSLHDPTKFYSDEKLLLMGIGLNRRKFIKDSYIFRNGQIEDVPIGRIYGITLGYQYKNSMWRPYAGAQFSFGNYYRFGFLSMNFEMGTYLHQSKTYQTSYLFEANYFTKLYNLGNWKLRQFINPKVVVGANHEDIIGDQLNINEQNGLAGFNSALYGTSKTVLSLQTQTYSPYALWGFRLNPFFNYSIAFLGSPNNAMFDSKSYSKVTLGLLISNDYLVFSSFQLSLSYYPSIPFQGDNVFKTNTFETTDYGLQSFELAKPKTVEYK